MADAFDRDLMSRSLRFLKEHRISYDVIDSTKVRASFASDVFDKLLLFMTVQDTTLLMVWTVPENMPMRYLDQTVLYVVRANYGLMIGHFALSMDTGDFRYYCSCDFKGMPADSFLVKSERTTIIEQLFNTSILCFKKYLPGFKKLTRGQSAENAMIDIEPRSGRTGPASMISHAQHMLDGLDIRYTTQGSESILSVVTLRGYSFPILIKTNESARSAMMLSILRMNEEVKCIPASRRTAVNEFITRANYGLQIGAFEMDFDDGSLHFHSNAQMEGLQDSDVEEVMKQMCIANMSAFSKYASGIEDVVRGANPKHSVDTIEGRTTQDEDSGGLSVQDLLLVLLLQQAAQANSGSKNNNNSGNAPPRIVEIEDDPPAPPKYPQNTRPPPQSSPQNTRPPPPAGLSVNPNNTRPPARAPPSPRSAGGGSQRNSSEEQTEAGMIKKDHLTLGASIGAGGMGEVYKGTYFGAPVAIKKVLAERSSPEADAAFRREIAIQSQLRFSRIVSTMGAANDGRNWLLVTEFCDLGNLSEVLNSPKHKAKMTPAMRMKMMVQAAQGMAFLHEHHILHLDLKPLNIFVTEDYSVKIGDFGLSKAVSTTIGRLRPREVQGFTLAYAAPEILTSQEVSYPADVYSFAVTVNEVMCGVMPYSEPPILAPDMLITMISNAATKRRPQIHATVYRPLADLIRKAWDHNPKVRPTFATLRTDLATVAEAMH